MKKFDVASYLLRRYDEDIHFVALDGLVNNSMFNDVERAINSFLKRVHEKKIPLNTCEFHVEVHTDGGEKGAGMGIYNKLRALSQSCKVVTHLIRDARSMGTIIFLAGDERIVYPDSNFYMHQASLGVNLDTNDTIPEFMKSESIRGLKMSHPEMIQIYRERTKISPGKIQKYYWGGKLFHARKSFKKFGKYGIATHYVEFTSK